MIYRNNFPFILLLFIVILVIFCGFAVRLYFLVNHFTHIDDIGIAFSIIEHKKEMIASVPSCNSNNLFFNCYYDYSKFRAESPSISTSSFISLLEKYNVDFFVRKLYFFYAQFHIIPLNWTYAPFQFYITQFLVNPGDTYSTVKLFGRLPSFIFFLTIFFFITPIIKLLNLSKHDFILSASVAFVLHSISWQTIIYSSQMENYLLSVVASYICLFIYLKSNIIIRNKGCISSPCSYGFILALLITCQYQVSIYVLSMFISLIFIHKSMNFINFPKFSVFFLLIFIPLVLLPMPSFSSNPGVNWNAGINNEFVVNSSLTLMNKFLKLFHVVTQLPLIIQSMLSPSHEENFYIQSILFLLFILGIYSFFNSKNNSLKFSFLIFFTVFIIIWLIFLLFSKITLSPTRHSMILIPFFVIFITEGLLFLSYSFFYNCFTKRTICILIFIVFIFFVFLKSIPNQIDRRSDLVNEVDLHKLLKNNGVNVISTNIASSPYLMPTIYNEFPIFDNLYSKSPSNNILTILQTKQNLIFAIFQNKKLDDYEINSILKNISDKNNLNFLPEKSILLFSSEIEKDVQIDWSSRTSNGKNSLYIYILQTSAY